MGISGLGAVLRSLHGTRKSPWLVTHPGLYLACPELREGKIGRLEGLTDIRESRLDTVNLRSVFRAKHESMNDFHEARFPFFGPCTILLNPAGVPAIAVPCMYQAAHVPRPAP